MASLEDFNNRFQGSIFRIPVHQSDIESDWPSICHVLFYVCTVHNSYVRGLYDGITVNVIRSA